MTVIDRPTATPGELAGRVLWKVLSVHTLAFAVVNGVSLVAWGRFGWPWAAGLGFHALLTVLGSGLMARARTGQRIRP